MSIPIKPTKESIIKSEYPSQRYFEYEKLLKAVGDPELKEISELPIFQKTFLLNINEGGRFSLDFRDIILGGGLTADNISTPALEHALLKSSAFEVVIISALDQMNDLKGRIDSDFELLLSTARTWAEAEIYTERLNQIKLQQRTTVGNITAQQISDLIIIHDEFREDYTNFSKLQHEAKNEIKYLEELLDTIRNRAMRIMHILNRRTSK